MRDNAETQFELARQRTLQAAAYRVHADRDSAFVGPGIRRGLAEARAVCAALRRAGAEPLACAHMLAAVQHEQWRCEEHDRTIGRRNREAVFHAIEALERTPASAELSRRAPTELRAACGFTRVMISRVHGTRWFPDTMRVDDGADPGAAEFARFAADDNQIPLAAGLAETRMLRSRRPVIVQDTASDRHVYKPLLRVTRSPAYVAAPILGDDRVIGFLHADRADQTNELTVGDLDSITLFAREFSALFETAVLHERMQQTETLVQRMLADTTRRLQHLSRVSPLLDGTATSPEPVTAVADPAAPQRDALLTTREREILELIAGGVTNQAVAQQLTISAETVKTHVSSILSKLRASSRAEAVARYLQLRDAGPGHRQ